MRKSILNLLHGRLISKCSFAITNQLKALLMQCAFLYCLGMCRLGAWGCRIPNIFKLARKLVNRQPCWKRFDNSIFCDLLFFSSNSCSIGQNTPSLQQKVSQDITACTLLCGIALNYGTEDEFFQFLTFGDDLQLRLHINPTIKLKIH